MDIRDIRECLDAEVAAVRDDHATVEQLRTSHRSRLDMERLVEEVNFKFDEMIERFHVEKRKSSKLKAKVEVKEAEGAAGGINRALYEILKKSVLLNQHFCKFCNFL